MDKPTPNLNYTEHSIEVFNSASIYAREYADNGPTIYLLHGFPDNLHLYDYLIPQIVHKFHVIVFDFLGWNRSSKPQQYEHTAQDQLIELEAVVYHFKANEFWLVAHDASGPPAINYALNHPDKVSKLVLLNTYYSAMEALRKPEAIWLFSTPGVRVTSSWVAHNIKFINRILYKLQVGRFMNNATRRKELLPKLYGPFSESANFNAFLKLNKDLDQAIVRNTGRLAEMPKLAGKVLIIFGANDPYLNIEVARCFYNLIPDSELNLIANASHYVQVDQPELIAEHLINNRNKQYAEQ